MTKRIKVKIEAEIELEPVKEFIEKHGFHFKTLEIAEHIKTLLVAYLAILTTKKYVDYENSKLIKISFDCEEVEL